jgi:hypothetical protein
MHVVLVAILTILVSTALCVCAILAHAPAMALPMIVAVCVGCPLFAGWNLPFALDSLRADRAGQRALASLRRGLAALPEIEHPLGF